MFNIAPNLPDRDFTVGQPNQKSAGDISYIWTCEGWLCLAVILDLRSRPVIALRVLHAKTFRGRALAVSNRMKRDLAIRALTRCAGFRSSGCQVRGLRRRAERLHRARHTRDRSLRMALPGETTRL